jgi:hypothetical protein
VTPLEPINMEFTMPMSICFSVVVNTDRNQCISGESFTNWCLEGPNWICNANAKCYGKLGKISFLFITSLIRILNIIFTVDPSVLSSDLCSVIEHISIVKNDFVKDLVRFVNHFCFYLIWVHYMMWTEEENSVQRFITWKRIVWFKY